MPQEYRRGWRGSSADRWSPQRARLHTRSATTHGYRSEQERGITIILSLSSITCACAPSFLLTHPFLVLQPSTPISCHLSKPTPQVSLPPPAFFFNSSSASYHCYALAYLVAVLHRQMILLRNRVIGLGGAVECNVLCYLPALGLRHFTCDL